MKTITKLFLMMALFGATVMAGDMDNGGFRQCTNNCPAPTTCQTDCSLLSIMPTDSSDAMATESVITMDDAATMLVKSYFGLNL